MDELKPESEDKKDLIDQSDYSINRLIDKKEAENKALKKMLEELKKKNK